jgi:VWFA-related protein
MHPSSSSRRNLLLSTLGLLPAARLLRSQQTQSAPTFSADVKVVNLFATVRDKDGRIVKNLTKEDFTLAEEGRPQTIRYFAQQTDLPLTLGLLVDVSGSERRMLGEERQASRTFLEKVLRPEKDKAFLIRFAHEVELLQDLTPSRERLEKALDLLDSPQQDQNGNSGSNSGGGGGSGGRYGGHRGGGTALFDAVYLAADEVLKPVSGRKALILLTDGEDNGSKTSLTEAIASSGRSDVIAYSIRIADDESGFSRGFGGPGMGGGRHGGMGGGGMGGPMGGGGMGRGRGGGMEHVYGKKILKQISKETGGAYFEKSKKKSIDDIYAQIEDELRSQYNIAYTPEGGGDSGFRKITLTAKQSGLTVQTREGYYATAGKPAS